VAVVCVFMGTLDCSAAALESAPSANEIEVVVAKMVRNVAMKVS
jgi:hypothetical protein